MHSQERKWGGGRAILLYFFCCCFFCFFAFFPGKLTFGFWVGGMNRHPGGCKPAVLYSALGRGRGGDLVGFQAPSFFFLFQSYRRNVYGPVSASSTQACPKKI